MKKFATLFIAVVICLISLQEKSIASVRELFEAGIILRSYDSLGVYTVQDAAAGAFTSLDTIYNWPYAKEQNKTVADKPLHILYQVAGGGIYTYAYLWAYPTSTPHADSVKGYVVIDQSIGGNAVWTAVDSVSVTTASTVAQKKVTLLAMPHIRIRTQGATATDKSTGVNILIKWLLVR